MNRKITSLILVVAVMLLAVLGAGCAKLRARDNLNKGVQAFKNGDYPAAVERFKVAVSLDPEFPTARLYLAMAYMMQWIPGAESPENTRMSQAAHDEFMKVLEQNPKNSIALAYLAKLYFDAGKLDEAREWYKKLISADPGNKEAYYTLGVIAWTKTYKPRMTARAGLGMKPEDPGPVKDKKVREELRAKHMPYIEEGIQSLEKALSIDGNYADAMAYMNLLLRERADLADSAKAYKQDTEAADNWMDKTLDAKKKGLEQKSTSAGGITTEK
jgi:tetratricopeptide (TPR) repeat protein